jgi:hypothetical protein
LSLYISTFKKSGAKPFYPLLKKWSKTFVSTFYKSTFGSTFSKGGFLKAHGLAQPFSKVEEKVLSIILHSDLCAVEVPNFSHNSK